MNTFTIDRELSVDGCFVCPYCKWRKERDGEKTGWYCYAKDGLGWMTFLGDKVPDNCPLIDKNQHEK